MIYFKTFRYEPPINNAYDLSDRNMEWGVPSDYSWVVFLRESENPKMKKLADNFVIKPEEYMFEKATSAEMGFAVEQMLGGKIIS